MSRYSKLSDEHSKLVGHRNHKQRIHYHMQIKKENDLLKEVGHTVSNNTVEQYFNFYCIGDSPFEIQTDVQDWPS